MKIKSQRDFLAGLLFIILGVFFAIGASRYPLGGSERPGAGFFPLILSALLAVLGASVLFKSLTIETEGGDSIGNVAWRPLILVTGSVAMFGLVLPRLGLVVTLTLLVFVVSLAGTGTGTRGGVGTDKDTAPGPDAATGSDRAAGWKRWLVRGVVLSVAAWLIFGWLLKLDAPLWPARGG